MKKILITVFALSAAGCTIGGTTTECSTDFDCGPGGACSEGVCTRPALPPPPAADPCALAGTPRTPISTADAAAFSLGRWRICERRGILPVIDAQADGLELGIDGFFRSLALNLEGELIEYRGIDGQWKIEDFVPGIMRLENTNLRYGFTDAPRKLELVAEDNSGALVLVPVHASALTCEKLPPPPTPFYHPACVVNDTSCWCPVTEWTRHAQSCRPDGAVECVCGAPAYDELRNGMIGVWRGTRRGASGVAREVYLRFDGRTHAPVCPGCDCGAVDWGRDVGPERWASYEIREIDALGAGSGTIEVYKSATGKDGAIFRQIRLSPDRNRLSFEIAHDEYATNIFELERATTATPAEPVYCGDRYASCECGAPRCCSLGQDRPIVCVTCAPDPGCP